VHSKQIYLYKQLISVILVRDKPCIIMLKCFSLKYLTTVTWSHTVGNLKAQNTIHVIHIGSQLGEGATQDCWGHYSVHCWQQN